MKAPILTIVVPCYNEEEILPHTFMKLKEIRARLIHNELVSHESKILFVDDGSKDRTWSLIYKEYLKNEYIRGLKLSRNVGHQNAILAGLFTAKSESDCIITIDADLQDDVNAIEEFIRKFHEGYEIVYGVRKSRTTDTFFKRNSAQVFYKMMNKMGVELIYNHADFRLMSRRAVEELSRFREANLFLRGIVPLIGFKSVSVYFDRKERIAGKTKYPLRRMLSFAFEGITSFSVLPIHMVTFLGGGCLLISFALAFYDFFIKPAGNGGLSWEPLMVLIWFVCGLQLVSIGIIGAYVGKIHKEVKERPRYIIEMDTFHVPLEAHKGDPFQTEKEFEERKESWLKGMNH